MDHDKWNKEKIDGENKLTANFEFTNFIEATNFVQKIVPLAEKMQHHPDIFIHDYKKVKITLFTHDQSQITEKDYSLAKKIDQIAS